MHPRLHLSLGFLAIGRCDGGLILGAYLLEAHRDLCACSYRGGNVPCEPIVIRPWLDERLRPSKRSCGGILRASEELRGG